MRHLTRCARRMNCAHMTLARMMNGSQSQHHLAPRLVGIHHAISTHKSRLKLATMQSCET